MTTMAFVPVLRGPVPLSPASSSTTTAVPRLRRATTFLPTAHTNRRARPIPSSARAPTMSTPRADKDPASLWDRVVAAFCAVAPELRRAAVLAAAVAVVAATMPALAPAAWAARTGGRVGGSSFRSAPSRSYSAPPRSSYGGGGGGVTIYQSPAPSIFFPGYYAPGYGGWYVGGGFGSLVLAAAVVSAVGVAYSNLTAGAAETDIYDPTTTVSVVKVGLLSSARELQDRLNDLGRFADTSTPKGLHYILQETVLSLIRNPDYWCYASVSNSATRMSSAEQEFAKASMGARTKIKEETLTNVDSRKIESSRKISFDEAMSNAPSEYIVVTLIVANEGKVKLPRRMRNTQDVQDALSALGGVSPEAVQAVEVIWSPQAENSTPTEAEMLLDNPDLVRI